MRFEPRKRPFLIGPHQPAVSGHICGENGGQPAFDAFRGQSGAPQPHGPNGLSALGAHSNGKPEGCHSLLVRRLVARFLYRSRKLSHWRAPIVPFVTRAREVSWNDRKTTAYKCKTLFY